MSGSRSIKKRVLGGETLFGCFILVPSPAVVEMVGYAGFDYVILDREHGGAGMEAVEHQLRAAEASGTGTLVRIPSAEPWEILWALDAGAEGILVPHVRTAGEARAIVSAAHYPPNGTRGLATTARAGRHGFVGVDDHLRRAGEETFVMLQIEDAEALPQVAEIAATPGVDAVFIGPADLSISLGHPGNAGHPEVAAAIDQIIADVNGVGGPVLASFARAADDAEALQKKGIKLVCLSTTALFSSRLREVAQELMGS